MAWDQLWITKPHIAYAIIGGFTTIFSLISLFVKEKLYIGEATVATIVGVIFGPHALDWFNPSTWGNVDYITLEISRIVLIVQIFAVAVELPKKYMLRHWISVFYLLVPVMTFGWLISSVFIWKLVPSLRWVEALVVAACITATDPVLASAVVGKGKFAKRVPGHLRNLLSAESGCNDGMAFPFAYLSLYLIRYAGHGGEIVKHWILITVLYECIFGCILGVVIGYSGRHLIKFAESHNLIDRESFLVFYFVLALFCTGVGSILGTDDLLVSFAAGAAFSWDGWFTHKTEESHVSNVIDLLLNLAYFVYFGAIVPWSLYDSPQLGISPWKLSILAILIILFRRIPIMLMIKPIIPDIRTWREALFCGHFGPIGVGAIFITILARAELEHDSPTPLAELPPEGSENYMVVAVMWPVVTFLVIASIIVHGSSIAVFTLGKRLNTMAITMSYTTGNGNGPSWLQRLPRIESGQSLSFRKVDTMGDDSNLNRLFHRHPTDADGEPRRPAKAAGRMSRPRKRKSKKGDVKLEDKPMPLDYDAGVQIPENVARRAGEATLEEQTNPTDHTVYQEGPHLIVEDANGEVLTTINSDTGKRTPWVEPLESLQDREASPRRRRASSEARREHDEDDQSGTKAIAYQLDDEIIVENEEGEVIRRYRINRHRPAGGESGLDRALSWVGLRRGSTAVGAHNTHGGDLEMQKVESSGEGTSGSSSGSGLEKNELPKNFLQRMTTEDEVVVPRSRKGRSHADDEEETPAERKRRLAALQGSERAEKEEEERAQRARRISNDYFGVGGEEDIDDANDYDEDDDDEDDGGPPVSARAPTPRISFAGETEGERRERFAALGLVSSDEQEPAAYSSSAGQPDQPRGITWGADVKKSK
ncbi:Sodium/hydrogen exchanger family-domain-containing protein [Lipomyces tetrasporus]|uniref:Sodium/hydrogen exchanger family-domain-containing protein n=1 Tax=Lipomyces tetrasporus TaxID=54092 RepID=A0AAD7QTK9_9ASCO|nr:Sodium/hydrogen exchanger family-domain-containing protein [Lipomyces tetrasporus]KAJ8101058.1 Sodium/hydrogen exchanger family-domain-containing protein [Lipomyces tetrasporus]